MAYSGVCAVLKAIQIRAPTRSLGSLHLNNPHHHKPHHHSSSRMAQHLGHRQLARDFQPVSKPVLVVPAAALAITTIQGLEIVAVQ
jgi:hypothetical protein